jgi:hypothetical protein
MSRSRALAEAAETTAQKMGIGTVRAQYVLKSCYNDGKAQYEFIIYNTKMNLHCEEIW